MALRIDFSRRNDLEGNPIQLYVMGENRESCGILITDEFENIHALTLFIRGLADYLDTEGMRARASHHGPISLTEFARL